MENGRYDAKWIAPQEGQAAAAEAYAGFGLPPVSNQEDAMRETSSFNNKPATNMSEMEDVDDDEGEPESGSEMGSEEAAGDMYGEEQYGSEEMNDSDEMEQIEDSEGDRYGESMGMDGME